jgi:excisionase family DNA binding protein
MTTANEYPVGFAEREPYVTKQHIAQFYGFTPRWVELKVAGGMPCHRFGSRVRFRVSEVEAWLQSAASAYGCA